MRQFCNSLLQNHDVMPWRSDHAQAREKPRERSSDSSTLPQTTLTSSIARPELRPGRHDIDGPAIPVRPPIAVSYVRTPEPEHFR